MLKEIEIRRSCRSFDPHKVVEEEKLNEVINAGLHAAAGMGTQNGIIICIVNKEIREKLVKLNAKIFNRVGDPFYNAPVILLVAVKKCPFTRYDGAAMIQNMMVEATHQGLGTCWIHRAKEELESKEGQELFSSLGLNFDEFEGIGHVALGYALSPNVSPKTIKENRVYYLK